jgi:dCTP deaminase
MAARLPRGTTLSREGIRRLLKSSELQVTPILDLEKQLGTASLDVRLGDEFIAMHRAELACLDPRDAAEMLKRIPQYQYKGRVRPFSGNAIVLHPGQLIIGTTLEYFKMPLDVMGYVIGRSSWGRLGLIVATATFIDPGFRGVIVLELVNDGEIPLALYPGIRIAQLVFQKLDRAVKEYAGKYAIQTRPMFSEVLRERDLHLFTDRPTNEA